MNPLLLFPFLQRTDCRSTATFCFSSFCLEGYYIIRLVRVQSAKVKYKS